MDELLTNLPIGGGMGTIKKVTGVASKLDDAAVLLKRADVDKVVEVPAGSKGNWDPMSCPSVRNSFFAEFQRLFFQRPASLGWFLMGLLHLWVLRCACFLCNFRHTRRHCPWPMRTVLFELV